jgi:tight adherence protein B
VAHAAGPRSGSLKPQEWFLIRLSAAIVGVAVAVVLLPWWLLTGPLVGLAFWLATGFYVRIKATRRLKRFADNLPDVLQLIAGQPAHRLLPAPGDRQRRQGRRAAHGRRAVTRAGGVRLGVELEDTLDRVADRMKSTDLAWTVMAVRIAREVGGNLAEVLMSTAETMRERGRIQRQVRALSAEGRLSAYILLGCRSASPSSWCCSAARTSHRWSPIRSAGS